MTPLVAKAATAMLEAGVRDVRNQGVLMRGVNDSPEALLDLCFALQDEAMITPYYFYMCDMIPFSEHWRVSLREAQELQHAIMGYLPGFATPRIVCDVPFVGKRWVHQVESYDTVRGMSFWRKHYRTSIEAGDDQALSREYVYHDPIYTLPEEGQEWWRPARRGRGPRGRARRGRREPRRLGARPRLRPAPPRPEPLPEVQALVGVQVRNAPSAVTGSTRCRPRRFLREALHERDQQHPDQRRIEASSSGLPRLRRTVGAAWAAVRGSCWPSPSVIAMMVGASAPSPFYPVLQQEIGFSAGTMTTIFGVYALTLLATLLVSGSLSDHIGRRPVLAVGFVVLAASMVGFWHADSVATLLVSRAVQGVAGGLLLSTMTAAVTDLEPASRPGLAATLNSVTPLFGLAAGALVAGAVLDAAPAAP